MAAPDKIYVNFEQDYFVPAIEERLNCQIEYIRKDALLEWLKSERKKCESKDVELWQRINAFTDVIEKIESL